MKFYKVTPEESRVLSELKFVGVDKYAYGMSKKGVAVNLLLKDVTVPACNIIKQEALASGMDAAVEKGIIAGAVDKSDILLLGNYNTLTRLAKRLKLQYFGLDKLAEDLSAFLREDRKQANLSLSIKDQSITFDRTYVMGILNVTPDSFSDGGKFVDESAISSRIDEMVSAGADIIDIGGMSTRPFSEPVSYEDEIKRIEFAVDYALKYKDKVFISVDTNNYKTAEFVLQKGAHIINDVSGMEDDNMIKVCKEHNASVCIMHMKGKPADMQINTEYNNLMHDIYDFFESRIDKCLQSGMDFNRIMLDVGFGFGKSVEQNYTLLKYMKEFKSLFLPMIAGISRKSMIGEITGEDVNNRLTGTIAANTIAIQNGANIIRVHDIKEGVDTAKIADTITKACT